MLVAGQELHLPLNQPVKVLLRSKDVLHDFTVPQFRVKMDMVPGMVTYLWLTPTRTGPFEILCEELCGAGHFVMRGRVVVDDAAAYQSWLADQPTYSPARWRARRPSVAAGQATFAVCSACHGANAEGNQSLNAPKLAGQPGWYLARQLRNFKHGVRGGAPGDAIASQMMAIAAPLDAATIDNVVAYIATLPDNAFAGHGAGRRGARRLPATPPAPTAMARRARDPGPPTPRDCRT